eukprot:459035-Amphidinium_carterae.1
MIHLAHLTIKDYKLNLMFNGCPCFVKTQWASSAAETPQARYLQKCRLTTHTRCDKPIHSTRIAAQVTSESKNARKRPAVQN